MSKIKRKYLDFDIYTQEEVDSISGSLASDIDTSANETYNSAVGYTDYYIGEVSTTVSGHVNDATIHFVVSEIKHDLIDNLGVDSHLQYHNDTRGDARYYQKNQVDTISGSINAKIITTHAGLSNLDSDDHTQYMLVDGSRGFTETVSGVVPIYTHHLATKGYVDSHIMEGISVSATTHPLVSGTTSTVVDFGVEFPNVDYGIAVELQNLVDENPSVYDFTITDVTTSGFSVEFTGVIDSDNYYLRYVAITSGTISATDHGSLSGLLDDDHEQYFNTTRGDARYSQLGHGHTSANISDFNEAAQDAVGTIMKGEGGVIVVYDDEGEEITITISGGGSLNNIVEDTTPQLGGDLDMNGKSLNYGATISGNGTYVGDYLSVVVDDANVVFGNVLYQASDFKFKRADADSTSTAPVYMLGLETGSGTKKVLVRGQVCNTSWNWNAGKLYLSTDVGLMTQTKPSGSGKQIQVLGFALSANTIWFDPVTMIAEVA